MQRVDYIIIIAQVMHLLYFLSHIYTCVAIQEETDRRVVL